MLLALTARGLSEAVLSAQRGTCPGCKKPVVAKVGEVVSAHWAHLSGQDCDTWYEMTAWHKQWQEQVPIERREVVIGDHRADVVTPSGWVVEFQHSPIDPAEVAKREAHYGTGIWVVDTSTRTHPPAWTRKAKWRVFYDNGRFLTCPDKWLGQIPYSWLVSFMNSEQHVIGLAWPNAKTRKGMCVICSRECNLIDPRDDQPKHKVCAEEFEVYKLTA